MDYNPVNIVPEGEKQGDYFSTTIGPYDMWAIEYGYKPLSAVAGGEVAELKKIAARSGEPGLAFRHGRRHPRHRPRSAQRPLRPGQRPGRLRQVAGEAGRRKLAERRRRHDERRRRLSAGAAGVRHAAGAARRSDVRRSRYVGGLYVSRSHKGDGRRRSRSKSCRSSGSAKRSTLLEEQVFSDKPFNFPPELYNHLAASHWDHWGTQVVERGDYPAHDVILMWQDRIAEQAAVAADAGAAARQRAEGRRPMTMC